MNQIKSSLLKLNLKDILRGLALGFGTAATYLFAIMSSGQIPTIETLKATGAVFVGSAGTYLIKNFLTNSNDEFLKSEEK